MFLQYSLQFALFQHRDLTKSILYTNSMALKAKTGLLVQDGGAEGRAFLFSGQSTKTAISCWTTSTEGRWNPPKKDNPRPKTKKQPQWDGRRGTITINLNPIPTYGWVTHRLENRNTKDVLTLLWRFWTPCQFSQPEDPTKGLGIPRESGLEGQWDLIRGLPEYWGKQTPVLEGTNKILHAPRPRGEEQWPHRRLSQSYLLVLEGFLSRRELVWAHHRDGGTRRSPLA